MMPEDAEMADIGSGGMKKIGPGYPVRPVQPSHKDRKSGQREKTPTEKKRKQEDDDSDKPTIDEYI